MAIGFDYGGSSNAVPDKTMTRKSAPKVLKAVFGDGYEQRVANGINNIHETYSVSFSGREKDFIDDVIDFLDTKAGVTKFAFIIPDTNSGGEQTVQVVCDDYSTNFEHDDFYSLTATFRRIYES